MNKNKEPVNWDDMDFKVCPRMSHESQDDFLHRQMLMELIQQQVEKRRASE